MDVDKVKEEAAEKKFVEEAPEEVAVAFKKFCKNKTWEYAEKNRMRIAFYAGFKMCLDLVNKD